MSWKSAALVLVSSIALQAACSGGAPAGPTVAQLEEAQTKVHAMQPKAAALEAVTPILGAPTSQDDTSLVWHARDGESCKALTVQLMGDSVGTVAIAPADCP